MSRRTSDVHDNLSKQDGFSGGKNTTFNGREPDMSLDYNDAAAAAPSLLATGDKRWSRLTADGAIPARGSAAGKFGFVLGQQFGDYATGSGKKEGDKFAALVLPEPGGLGIWRPVLISADVFQSSLRGGASGVTTDADDSYMLAEDKRNPQFSVAVYERFASVPASKVYDAYTDGLVQRDVAETYFSKSAKWAAEDAKRRAKDAQDVAAQRKAEQEVKRIENESKPVLAFELTQLGDGTFFVAKTAAESADASDGGNPHPGVNVAGLNWRDYGKPGDKSPLLTWDDGNIRAVTMDEFNAILSGAKNGNDGDAAALAYLGLFKAPVAKNPLALLFG